MSASLTWAPVARAVHSSIGTQMKNLLVERLCNGDESRLDGVFLNFDDEYAWLHGILAAASVLAKDCELGDDAAALAMALKEYDTIRLEIVP